MGKNEPELLRANCVDSDAATLAHVLYNEAEFVNDAHSLVPKSQVFALAKGAREGVHVRRIRALVVLMIAPAGPGSSGTDSSMKPAFPLPCITKERIVLDSGFGYFRLCTTLVLIFHLRTCQSEFACSGCIRRHRPPACALVIYDRFLVKHRFPPRCLCVPCGSISAGSGF